MLRRVVNLVLINISIINMFYNMFYIEISPKQLIHGYYIYEGV